MMLWKMLCENFLTLFLFAILYLVVVLPNGLVYVCSHFFFHILVICKHSTHKQLNVEMGCVQTMWNKLYEKIINLFLVPITYYILWLTQTAYMFLTCNIMLGGSAPEWFGLQGS